MQHIDWYPQLPYVQSSLPFPPLSLPLSILMSVLVLVQHYLYPWHSFHYENCLHCAPLCVTFDLLPCAVYSVSSTPGHHQCCPSESSNFSSVVMWCPHKLSLYIAAAWTSVSWCTHCSFVQHSDIRHCLTPEGRNITSVPTFLASVIIIICT